MSSKLIRLRVWNCSSCPYCQYNPHYSMSENSGYDCAHGEGPGRLWSDHENTDWAIHPNCPLPGCSQEDKDES